MTVHDKWRYTEGVIVEWPSKVPTDAFNPYHEPPGSRIGGRFAKKPAGGGDISGAEDAFWNLSVEGLAATMGSSEPPVYVDNVNDALTELAAGKKVVLEQPDQVASLLDEIQQRVLDAKERGETAPDYDLCNVSVRGTNVFCAEHVGIKRIQMPQLSGVPRPGSWADEHLPKNDRGEADLSEAFREHMRERGVGMTSETVKASHLKATQMELQGRKVAYLYEAHERGEYRPASIFISSDNYIVDGHHRWASEVAWDFRDNIVGDDVDMQVERVDLPILEVLAASYQFGIDNGIDPAPIEAGLVGAALLDLANPYHDEKGRFTHGPGGRRAAGKGNVKPLSTRTLERAPGLFWDEPPAGLGRSVPGAKHPALEVIARTAADEGFKRIEPMPLDLAAAGGAMATDLTDPDTLLVGGSWNFEGGPPEGVTMPEADIPFGERADRIQRKAEYAVHHEGGHRLAASRYGGSDRKITTVGEAQDFHETMYMRSRDAAAATIGVAPLDDPVVVVSMLSANGMSQYGLSQPAEAYAEAYASWKLGGNSPIVQGFAAIEEWER